MPFFVLSLSYNIIVGAFLYISFNHSKNEIKTMGKNKDQKRKMQLAIRAKNESLRFQVEFMKKQKGIDIAGMEQELEAELDAICQNALTDNLLTLVKIIEGVEQDLGYKQEVDRCSLNGTLVPFILGITAFQPNKTDYVQGVFAAKQPLQVAITYDNEIRNRVVDWVRERYDGVTTRLAQPILKLGHMVVEFKRVVK